MPDRRPKYLHDIEPFRKDGEWEEEYFSLPVSCAKSRNEVRELEKVVGTEIAWYRDVQNKNMLLIALSLSLSLVFTILIVLLFINFGIYTLYNFWIWICGCALTINVLMTGIFIKKGRTITETCRGN